MIIRSTVLAKFGDNIATEMIASAAFVTSSKPDDLGRIACKGIDPYFVEKMKPGGVLVGGKNFGCSSSREWAPVALKAAGVKLIIADFFARIFYRNAVNLGLPIVECPGISQKLQVGDTVEVDLEKGTLKIPGTGETLEISPTPLFLIRRLEVGGLIPELQKEFQKRSSASRKAG
jgi:3-isopropylmalate/(R)-2-methylmalate dehydratase small subunit